MLRRCGSLVGQQHMAPIQGFERCGPLALPDVILLEDAGYRERLRLMPLVSRDGIRKSQRAGRGRGPLVVI